MGEIGICHFHLVSNICIQFPQHTSTASLTLYINCLTLAVPVISFFLILAFLNHFQ